MIRKFDEWLATAKPGYRFEYHRGPHLCNADGSIADRAMAASKARDVLLVRRKYGPDDFGYIAVRVSDECPAKMFPARCMPAIKPARVRVRVRKAPA